MYKGTISAHHITCADKFTFNPNMYSQFKFGCIPAANYMGEELAETVIEYDRKYNLLGDRPIVVCPSAYATIPAASVQLKEGFVKHLHRYLGTFGDVSIEEERIYRTHSYVEDYGTLSKGKREKLISNDKFTIDSSKLRDKLVLFIDDAYITGTHELATQKMIDSCKHSFEYMYLYYAQVRNKTIDCRVEDTINMWSIKSLKDLDFLIKKYPCTINVRMIKFILSSDPRNVSTFLREMSIEFLDDLKRAVLIGKYYTVAAYRKNISNLNKIIHELRSPQAVGA